jgi:integrase/recombinase XerD
MWDDAFDDFWSEGKGRKKSGKFFTWEEDGWAIIREQSWPFEAYLDQANMSASATRSYPAHVADFYTWMQEHVHHQPPRHLYREHILKYRDDLIARRVKPQTINHKLSALKKYNEYLIARKWQRHEVFRRGDFVKVRPKTPQAFRIPDSRIRNFLAKVRDAGNLRDTALVTLLAYTGMKLQEALELHTLDFDWKRAEVTVNAGDRKKERHVPLHEAALEALQAYQQRRHTDYPRASSYFFAGRGSYKLTYSTVNRLFKQHSKTITPKTLRQWFQVDMLNRGATVAEVVHLTGADAQTVSGLVKRQADKLRQQVSARQL